MGSLGKNGENDKEVEQLIDEPTNGSGDPDLGQIFLQIWLNHLTQIVTPELSRDNNHCGVTFWQNRANFQNVDYCHSKRQVFPEMAILSDYSFVNLHSFATMIIVSRNLSQVS